MKLLRRFLFFLAALSGALAHAHPVSQGAVDLQVFPTRLELNIRVSGEEILVADTFAARAGSNAAPSLAEVWRQHGAYLLAHFHVFADERGLVGRLTEVSPAKSDWVAYRLEFALTKPPARVWVEEDVLNEIEFAPGNPWEASYIVRFEQDGRLREEGALLSRRQPFGVDCRWDAAPVSSGGGTTDRWRMAGQFVRHGVMHILTGYDHLLFVSALALGALTFLDLIKVVSVFTLAHTLTLALSVLNVVRLPSSVVEPMIAASIVFVAVANFLWPKRTRGRARLATAFFFGLFHGLGFAGGLLDAMDGMSGVSIGVAIAAFSLGVELGHQAVTLPLFFGLRLAGRIRTDASLRERFHLNAMRSGSALISAAGFFYLVAALRQ